MMFGNTINWNGQGSGQRVPPAAPFDPQPDLIWRDNGQIVLANPTNDPVFEAERKVGVRRYTLGVDIGGEGNDPSALCLYEYESLPWLDANNRQHLTEPTRTVLWTDMVRQPDTPSMVDFIVRTLMDIRARVAPSKVHVAHDATGLGAPYTSLLKQAKVPPHPIQFTAGEAVTRHNQGGRISKNVAIEQMAIALHNGTLRFADGLPQMETVMEHIASVEMTQSASGRVTYKQGGKGHHADLMSAIAIAHAYDLWFRTD